MSSSNIRDSRSTNTISQSNNAIAARVERSISNLGDLFRGEFMRGVYLANSLPSCLNHFGYILASGAKMKMRRIYASKLSIVAGMKNTFSSRYVSIRKFVGYPMCQFRVALSVLLDTKNPVPKLIPITNP